MNLRKHITKKAQEIAVEARGITPAWTEFYTLIPCRLGYIVWDEAKQEAVTEVGDVRVRIFSYIDALKYACTAPRVLLPASAINTETLG